MIYSRKYVYFLSFVISHFRASDLANKVVKLNTYMDIFKVSNKK